MFDEIELGNAPNAHERGRLVHPQRFKFSPTPFSKEGQGGFHISRGPRASKKFIRFVLIPPFHHASLPCLGHCLVPVWFRHGLQTRCGDTQEGVIQSHSIRK